LSNKVSESTLLAIAAAARARAYAPYSRFAVGAALLTAGGAVFAGANMENASYGLTVCAERVALWNARLAGHHRFSKLAVVADSSPPPAPCGACRQVILELAGDIEVVMGNLQGEIVRRSARELLPLPFTGDLLPGEAALPAAAAGDLWRLPLALRPIGRVRSSLTRPSEVPGRYKPLLSEIHLDPELEEGLYRIEEESRIIVIGYLHLAEDYVLKGERSGRGGEVYGVFACRTPYRPNPISMTEVDLVERRGHVLIVRGLDLIDGTPVLDLKTVIPPTGKQEAR
jgi:cytidine deaminase